MCLVQSRVLLITLTATRLVKNSLEFCSIQLFISILARAATGPNPESNKIDPQVHVIFP